MHTAVPPVLALLLPLLAASCRATDDTQAVSGSPPTAPPATAPGTLAAVAKVIHTGNAWSVEITLTNPTDHPLTMGRYSGFVVIRTDTDPPAVVAKSPDHTMAPHFRLVVAPGESRVASVSFWDQPATLPVGHYRVVVTFPQDILPAPVEGNFTVAETATTAPTGP